MPYLSRLTFIILLTLFSVSFSSTHAQESDTTQPANPTTPQNPLDASDSPSTTQSNPPLNPANTPDPINTEPTSTQPTAPDKWESFSDVWASIQYVWRYEIVSLGGNQPLTVGKIVIAILLFLLGLYFSRLISSRYCRRAFNRFGFSESATSAFVTIIFYILIIIFTLLALQVAEVPLTIFTVLGGAVAIGVGFGSQNIMNNFISGLIILAERPVRVGDSVELGTGIQGTITKIGARSTIVQNSSRIEIIVPNSFFLEQSVINWTLTDRNVRTSVLVGVAYGSDTEKVKTLLLKSIKDHPKIKKSPDPTVTFNDFAADALLFEVHYWINFTSQFERRVVCSDVRFKIDALFRESNISIAFPQRDVHLDTNKPLDIRMVNTSDD